MDLAFVPVMPKFKVLTLTKSTVANFEALASAAKLERLLLVGATGATSLAPLKGLANLSEVQVGKGAFAAEDMTGFASPKLAGGPKER